MNDNLILNKNKKHNKRKAYDYNIRCTEITAKNSRSEEKNGSIGSVPEEY